MRAKMAAAFALGFAAGILCLSVGLWWTGALGTSLRTAAATGNVAPGNVQLQPTPIPLPLPVPRPNEAAPPLNAPLAPVVDGAEALHLAIPIAGVTAKELTDTFNQARVGHKHEALDIPAPRGTPVMAAGEGNIVKLFTSKQGGLTVYQFNDSRTYCYYYAHLDRYAAGLREGAILQRGEVLGYVGSTGDASPEAPHLHFAVFKLGPEKKWWEGTAIDPLPLLR
jgi:peptidoglycan LD-endopeptidase LytH